MPDDLLRQAAQDAPADSSPATEPTDHADDGGDTPPADAGKSSDDAGKRKEPSATNVRGELLRLMDQRFARIEGMLAARQEPPGASQPGNASDLSNVSADQLEAMRPNIPQSQLPAFEKLVLERRISEQVRGAVANELSSQQLTATRRTANQEAFSRYPDLHNETSPMRRMTNKVLDEMGADPKTNPRVVLDAANEAAARLGVSPASRRNTTQVDVRTPGARTAPAPGAAEKSTLSDEKHDAISNALKGALPRGKTFNKERVAAAHAQYQAHRHLYVKP